MPMKDFRCESHDTPLVFEKLVKMDQEETECPTCGKLASRVYVVSQYGEADLPQNKSLRFRFNYQDD